MASGIDQIGIKAVARRKPCVVWVVFPSVLVATAVTVLWLLFDEQLFLWFAAPQLLLLTFAYARTRRLYGAYLSALRGMRRSERRYVLVLRSFSERSVHERSYSTVESSGLILHHMLTLVAPIEERCREMNMHCVVIGGGLVADAKADDVVIYLDYPNGGWESAFRRLALGAAAIIVCPETSPALITEIGYLRDNGLLPRTAFIAPPKALPSKQVMHHDQIHFENRWSEVRSKFND